MGSPSPKDLVKVGVWFLEFPNVSKQENHDAGENLRGPVPV